MRTRFLFAAAVVSAVVGVTRPASADTSRVHASQFRDPGLWLTLPVALGVAKQLAAIELAPRSPYAVTSVPVFGVMTSRFGRRRDPFTRRRKNHAGLDFAARQGTEVRAAGPGVVLKAGRMGGYGRVVIIDHGDGVETRYAHLRRIDVRPGDAVTPETPIGAVGTTGRSTGPHLHFEVRHDGRAVDPLQQLPPTVRFVLAVQAR